VTSVTGTLSWNVTPARRKKPPRRRVFRRLLLRLFAALLAAWSLLALALAAVRWVDPPFTAVHAQRRLQSWFRRGPYHKRYVFVPLDRISPELQHAVVAAEDARFFKHNGFDWHEIRTAVEDRLEDGRERGASTITQQLVKNLFFGTGRSFFRKGAEFTLVPVAELALGKRRILELYLNVIEWGPGIYGAEAASRYYYSVPCRRIGRDQAARLAAILPSPRRRRPERMNEYSARILDRMRQMGW
jgi:monofunctional biosynthetic peptidoglycan transglycosylase